MSYNEFIYGILSLIYFHVYLTVSSSYMRYHWLYSVLVWRKQSIFNLDLIQICMWKQDQKLCHPVHFHLTINCNYSSVTVLLFTLPAQHTKALPAHQFAERTDHNMTWWVWAPGGDSSEEACNASGAVVESARLRPGTKWLGHLVLSPRAADGSSCSVKWAGQLD